VKEGIKDTLNKFRIIIELALDNNADIDVFVNNIEIGVRTKCNDIAKEEIDMLFEEIRRTMIPLILLDRLDKYGEITDGKKS